MPAWLSIGDTLAVLLIGAVIFVLVIAVCAIVLGLLHFILPSYEHDDEDDGAAEDSQEPG